jgi:hypothetical protein
MKGLLKDGIQESNVDLEIQEEELDEADEELDALMEKMKQARLNAEKRIRTENKGHDKFLKTMSGVKLPAVKIDAEEDRPTPAIGREKLPSGI